MKFSWLNKKGNLNLIVFFSGWGMDEKSVILDYRNFDFIVLYDYEDSKIDAKLVKEISDYDNVCIIGWSMGVIMSTLLFDKINNIKKKIAVNGTLKIVDDKFGIPTKIFEATLNNLNAKTIEMFFKNMGYKDFKTPNRNFESQLNELKFIKNFYDGNIFQYNFDKVIIGNKDIIVPYRNQKRAWENNSCLYLDCGHYCFNLFNSWEDIANA